MASMAVVEPLEIAFRSFLLKPIMRFSLRCLVCCIHGRGLMIHRASLFQDVADSGETYIRIVVLFLSRWVCRQGPRFF